MWVGKLVVKLQELVVKLEAVGEACKEVLVRDSGIVCLRLVGKRRLASGSELG